MVQPYSIDLDRECDRLQELVDSLTVENKTLQMNYTLLANLTRNTTLDDAAAQCNKRADSLFEGSAVARQCAKDILAMKVR